MRAFGHTLGPDGLVVSYGIAAVLAALPITPAGLGVVEAFLIPSLVAFSVPQAMAVLGVLAWRTISFLLPIPAGGVGYLLLQTHSPATAGRATGLSSVGDGERPPHPRSSVTDDEFHLSGSRRVGADSAA